MPQNHECFGVLLLYACPIMPGFLIVILGHDHVWMFLLWMCVLKAWGLQLQRTGLECYFWLQDKFRCPLFSQSGKFPFCECKRLWVTELCSVRLDSRTKEFEVHKEFEQAWLIFYLPHCGQCLRTVTALEWFQDEGYCLVSCTLTSTLHNECTLSK